MKLVQLLKALSDETRLRILNLLRNEKLCVCEMEYLLDVHQSNASRHLSKLWASKLVIYEKQAQWVRYQLNENLLEEYPFIRDLLNTELDKLDIYNNDLNRLKEYIKSELTCEDIKLLDKSCGDKNVL